MSSSEHSEKPCTKCGQTLPLESFCRNRKAPDGRNWWCRDCAKEWRAANRDKMKIYQERYLAKPEAREKLKASRRAYRQRPDIRPKNLESLRRRKRYLRENHPNAQRLIAVKSQPCVDCGNAHPPQIMEMDHVRGERKFSLNLQQVVRPFCTAEVFEAELAKCEVRCPTCHRLRHFHASSMGRPLSESENGAH